MLDTLRLTAGPGNGPASIYAQRPVDYVRAPVARPMKRPILAGLAAVFVSFASANGLSEQAAERQALSERRTLYEGDGGANCEYFLQDILPWARRSGDWIDAQGKAFGDKAFAEASSGPGVVAFELTRLVRGWQESRAHRGQIFIRTVAGSGYAMFHSREVSNVADRPLLALEFADGHKDLLSPSADTHTECSTYKSSGHASVLLASDKNNLLLQFELPHSDLGRTLKQARLVLVSAGTRGAPVRVGVFQTAVPDFLPSGVAMKGLAADFSLDEGLSRHPDVMFASGFDDEKAWLSHWARGANGEMGVVQADEARHFQPLRGGALRINLRKGSNMGADLRVNLVDHGGEPDELFMRYYLRLANDWHPDVDGGKFPGMAGTYGRAGWGGRKSDGSNGWSARGAFLRAFPADHPMAGLTQLATYAYHMDMPSINGEQWMWSGALLRRNRWYCIEQQVQLNRPDRADGRMRAWVDGRLVLDKQGVRFRGVGTLHIETAWLNVFHGGSAVSPHDQHLYVDNVVLARRYIGPSGPARSGTIPIGAAP